MRLINLSPVIQMGSKLLHRDPDFTTENDDDGYAERTMEDVKEMIIDIRTPPGSDVILGNVLVQERDTGAPLVFSNKRKQVSPYGEVQISRALKIKKENDTSSPILRERLIRNLSTGGDVLHRSSSTPLKKRSTPKRVKRCLNPDNRQLLITSVFSPKVKRDENNGESGSHRSDDFRKNSSQ